DSSFQPKTAEGAIKPESQWTQDEMRMVLQDQHLKSIIMSCLPDDIMESVISYETSKATWTNLVYNFKGLSDTKENKNMDLKLKYQTFRAKPSESLSHTYTHYKTLLNEFTNDGVNLSKHEINVKVLMTLADDELSVGKNHARNSKWIDITMRKVNILLTMNEDADWQNYLNYINIHIKASPSSEVMSLTFQPHSPKERSDLGIVKHNKTKTQDSLNQSVSGTVIVSETEPTTPSVPTEVKNNKQESKINELTKLVQMYHATNPFASNSRCCTLDDLNSMIDKTHDVGLVFPMDIVPICRLRDLLEALMLIFPMQFGYLRSRCSRLAQNIENSHCIAMMEAVNGAKDLNVSVTVLAIEVSGASLFFPSDDLLIVNQDLECIKSSDLVVKKLLMILMNGLNPKEIDEAKESKLMWSKTEIRKLKYDNNDSQLDIDNNVDHHCKQQ
nr:feruloyl CoA ortho-hydroxylase 1-like [Tanacetum cinerariifolium]